MRGRVELSPYVCGNLDPFVAGKDDESPAAQKTYERQTELARVAC
jgi:hypothetical protein